MSGLLGIVESLLQTYSPQALIATLAATLFVVGVAFYLSLRGNKKKEQEERERQERKKKEEQEQLLQKRREQQRKKEEHKKKPKTKEQDHPLLAATLKGHEDDVTAVAFHPKGAYLASFSKDRTLRLFSVPTATEKEVKHQRINLDLDYGERASFSSDGRYLITVMADTKNVRIYEMKKSKDKGKWEAKAVKEFSTPHKAELNTLTMSANSKFMLSCSDDTTVILWGIPHANILENMSVKKGGNHMASLSPDSKHFTLATATGEVVIWEVSTKKGDNWEFDKTKKVAVLPNGHRTSVNAVSFSQDGHLLATGSKDCTWRLWDVNVRYALSEDPRCIHNVKLDHPVDNVSISPDNTVVLVLSNGVLHFYDAKNAALLASIPNPHGGNPLLSFSWSADSTYLATAGVHDRGIKLWRKPPTTSKN